MKSRTISAENALSQLNFENCHTRTAIEFFFHHFWIGSVEKNGLRIKLYILSH